MLKYRLGLSKAGRNGDDISQRVLEIAFPDDRRPRFNIKLDLGDPRYSSRTTMTINPVEGAVAIRK